MERSIHDGENETIIFNVSHQVNCYAVSIVQRKYVERTFPATILNPASRSSGWLCGRGDRISHVVKVPEETVCESSSLFAAITFLSDSVIGLLFVLGNLPKVNPHYSVGDENTFTGQA